VYNETAISRNHIELQTLLRICCLPNVVGVKESSGVVVFTRALLAVKNGVPVFQGWENLLLDTPGIDGFIGPLANLEPALSNTMLTALCERYGLFHDDWYLWVKKELHKRGIISSERIIDS
jgi:4-hydroxy-tetrahydrodipicolinate synthase